VGKLKQLTGFKIDSTHWTADRIHDAQERLYTLGDDDFCDFLDETARRDSERAAPIDRCGGSPG
jgi:hypothetical protein